MVARVASTAPVTAEAAEEAVDVTAAPAADTVDTTVSAALCAASLMSEERADASSRILRLNGLGSRPMSAEEQVKQSTY